MNHDDIIRMAKEAGFNQILATTTGANVWIDDGFYVEELERFAALVAAAERMSDKDDSAWQARFEELIREPDFEAIFRKFERFDLIDFIADLWHVRDDAAMRLGTMVERWAERKASDDT